MKKLISYIMIAASSMLLFACSQKVTIEAAANAAPKDTKSFVAYNITKSLQNDFFAQKGAKELAMAMISMIGKENKDLPEDLIKEAINSPEDLFFAMAGNDFYSDPYFVILNHSIIAKGIKEALEKNKAIEKSQKDKIDIFVNKNAWNPRAVAIKDVLVVMAKDGDAALKVMNDLKSKNNDSFASTEEFKKLASLKKDPMAAGFLNTEIPSEGAVKNLFFACSAENATQFSGVVKAEIDEMILKTILGDNLPKDNVLEIKADAKTLCVLPMIIPGYQNGSISKSDKEIFDKLCKKFIVSASVKLEPKEATVEFKSDLELDYEEALILLKNAR